MYRLAYLRHRACAYGKPELFAFTKRFKADNTSIATKVSKEIETTAGPRSKVPQSISIWRRLGPLRKAVDRYDQTLRARPYTTQVATSVTIYFFGDLGAQKIEGQAYDPLRAARNVTIGAVVSIPGYLSYISSDVSLPIRQR